MRGPLQKRKANSFAKSMRSHSVDHIGINRTLGCLLISSGTAVNLWPQMYNVPISSD